MTPCPQCGTLNPPGSALCASCGTSLAPRPGVAATASPAAATPSGAQPAAPAVDSPAPASRSLRAATVHEETETRAIPLPASTLSFPASSPSASGPSGVASGSTAASGSPHRAGVASQESEREEEESTLDPDHLETFTAFGEARRIVTVIGFGASGKTFLVNRLREALTRQMRWRTYPKKQDRIEITPEGLWLTEVNPTRQGRDKPLVLLDCAGESFQRAFDEQSTSASLSGVGVRSYLTALACASAYVFVIQAEHLADAASGNPNDKRKVAELCESFHEIIDGIRLAKAGLASAKGPKDFLARGIPRAEFKNVRKAPGPRLTEPLFVALSQADRLEGHEPLDDPLGFAYQGAASLVAAVEARFATYRFDFVSSFFEHKPTEDDPLGVDYGRPHYGVTEMFAWLEERLTRKGRRSLGDKLAGELETRIPLWLRRKVDPSVRLGGSS